MAVYPPIGRLALAFDPSRDTELSGEAQGNETLGGVPGFSGRRRGAEGGNLAARPHRWISSSSLVVAVTAGFVACAGAAAWADEKIPAATWYIVGGPEHGPAAGGDRIALDSRPRADFGVTFAGVAAGEVITFTSGATSPGAEHDDGYSFLVSGAYDFETGTLVTPRVVGGVGVSYVGSGAAGRLAAADPTARSEMTPTARIGFGADFDLGDYWAVSAEYSAMYLGETEREGRLGESRLDQKFTVGAKVRF